MLYRILYSYFRLDAIQKDVDSPIPHPHGCGYRYLAPAIKWRAVGGTALAPDHTLTGVVTARVQPQP